MKIRVECVNRPVYGEGGMKTRNWGISHGNAHNTHDRPPDCQNEGQSMVNQHSYVVHDCNHVARKNFVGQRKIMVTYYPTDIVIASTCIVIEKRLVYK